MLRQPAYGACLFTNFGPHHLSRLSHGEPTVKSEISMSKFSETGNVTIEMDPVPSRNMPWLRDGVLLRHVPAHALHNELELVRPKQRIVTQFEREAGELFELAKE